MSAAGWGQLLGTAFLGLAGLWLAHNYRRQIRIKLAERQVDSYLHLWTLTAVATPERTEPLDDAERRKLYDDLVSWYFADGYGIFASASTRDLFVGYRSNLVCPLRSVLPAELAQELAAMDPADAERRRGCVTIRQASLLRAQLKADLTMHFGFDYYSRLRPDDRAFLRSCGLSLWRRPWRSRVLRRHTGRGSPNPCVCGLCPSAA